MRAPPESLKPTSGVPFFSAYSCAHTIFLACILPSVPPTDMKSWLKAATWRPSTWPVPTITPSAGNVLVGHVEGVRAVADVGAVFLEGLFLEEGGEALARRQEALVVPLLNFLLAAGGEQPLTALKKRGAQFLIKRHDRIRSETELRAGRISARRPPVYLDVTPAPRLEARVRDAKPPLDSRTKPSGRHSLAG